MAADLPLTPARGAAAAACAPDACADRRLALLLVTIWATRTGRTPPAVPLSELSPDELVHFWADGQLESPFEANDQTASAGSGASDESERLKRQLVRVLPVRPKRSCRSRVQNPVPDALADYLAAERA